MADTTQMNDLSRTVKRACDDLEVVTARDRELTDISIIKRSELSLEQMRILSDQLRVQNHMIEQSPLPDDVKDVMTTLALRAYAKGKESEGNHSTYSIGATKDEAVAATKRLNETLYRVGKFG